MTNSLLDLVLTFGKFVKSLGATLAVSAISACGDWPPHGDDLVTYVNEHKGQIETLVSDFRDSDFGRISCTKCTWEDVEPDDQTDSQKFIDGFWERVENPKGQHYANLLKAAGVYGVSKRSNGEIELIIAVSSGVDDPRYTIQLFHDPRHSSGTLKECVDDFKEIDCGWCKVSIDESLWIRYQWHPKDADPAASQARDDKEISWEEWESRDEAAQDACWKQGLLEQGYQISEQ